MLFTVLSLGCRVTSGSFIVLPDSALLLYGTVRGVLGRTTVVLSRVDEYYESNGAEGRSLQSQRCM